MSTAKTSPTRIAQAITRIAQAVCVPPTAAINRWSERHPAEPGLAGCRLAEPGPSAGVDGSRQKRARKLAGDAIDGISDTTTTTDDRTSRKRNLLGGPEEFSRVRTDRIKTIRRVDRK